MYVNLIEYVGGRNYQYALQVIRGRYTVVARISRTIKNILVRLLKKMYRPDTSRGIKIYVETYLVSDDEIIDPIWRFAGVIENIYSICPSIWSTIENAISSKEKQIDRSVIITILENMALIAKLIYMVSSAGRNNMVSIIKKMLGSYNVLLPLTSARKLYETLESSFDGRIKIIPVNGYIIVITKRFSRKIAVIKRVYSPIVTTTANIILKVMEKVKDSIRDSIISNFEDMLSDSMIKSIREKSFDSGDATMKFLLLSILGSWYSDDITKKNLVRLWNVYVSNKEAFIRMLTHIVESVYNNEMSVDEALEILFEINEKKDLVSPLVNII